MRITQSSRKHGFNDDDILHALRRYLRVIEDDEVAMFIGPTGDGTVIGVGVVLDDEDSRIIHAMPARRRFWP